MKIRKRELHFPNPYACWLLRISLAVIALSGVSTMIAYLEARAADAVLANDLWSRTLADFLAAIALAIGLSMLVDAIECDWAKRNGN